MFTLFITLLQRLFLTNFKREGGFKENIPMLKFEIFLYSLIAIIIFIKWLLRLP